MVRGAYSRFKELAEKLLRGVLVPTTLHENIQHVAVLIHGSPEVMAFAMNRQENLVQVPFVTRSGAPVTQLVSILLAELAAPLADRFIGDNDPTDEQELFHIAVAERKAEIQPNGVADDLPREPMMFIEIRRG
jgi:hypothetical protein